jgi:hypothetical protein
MGVYRRPPPLQPRRRFVAAGPQVYNLILADTETSLIETSLAVVANHVLAIAETAGSAKENILSTQSTYVRGLSDTQTFILDASIAHTTTFSRSLVDSETSFLESSLVQASGRNLTLTDTALNYADTIADVITREISVPADTAFHYGDSVVFATSHSIAIPADTAFHYGESLANLIKVKPMALVDPQALFIGDSISLQYNFAPRLTDTNSLIERSLSSQATHYLSITDTAFHYAETLNRSRFTSLHLSDIQTDIVDSGIIYQRTNARVISDTSSIRDVSASIVGIRSRNITDTAFHYGETLHIQHIAVPHLTDGETNLTEIRILLATTQSRILSDTQTNIVEQGLALQYVPLPVVYNLTLADTQTHIVTHSISFVILPEGLIRIYPAKVSFPLIGGPKRKLSVYQTNYSGAFVGVSSDPSKVTVQQDPNDFHGFLLTSISADTSGVTISFAHTTAAITATIEKLGLLPQDAYVLGLWSAQ